MQNSDQPLKEKELLRLLVKSDRVAYRQLYRQHLHTLHRFILPFANHDQQEADRIVQDVFVKIWERREKLVYIKSFEAYLFKMAKNRLYDLHKQRQARKAMYADMEHDKRSSSAHESLVFEEYLESAHSIIEDLTPQRKRIFLMRTQTEMSIAEIASTLKISKSAVKKQLYEAIKMVKSRLSKEHDWPLMWWIVWVMVPMVM